MDCKGTKKRVLNLFRCQVLNEAAIKMTEMTNVHRFIIDKTIEHREEKNAQQILKRQKKMLKDKKTKKMDQIHQMHLT